MTIIRLFYCCEKMFFPYEYMDDWEKFNETLAVKKNFQSLKY